MQYLFAAGIAEDFGLEDEGVNNALNGFEKRRTHFEVNGPRINS